MGCSSSRPSTPPGPPIRITGAVSDDIEMVPTQQANYSNAQAQAYQSGGPSQSSSQPLDRDALLQALQLVAQSLHRRGFHLTIVTLGGAVNTIHLRTRQSTEDVDFFAPLSRNEAEALRAAVQDARSNSRVPLPRRWLNNSVTSFLPTNANQGHLLELARRQNVHIFHSQGLEVLAAPWSYMLVAKIDRMFLSKNTSNARTYDAADAASYLHAYIEGHGGRKIKTKVIQEWAHNFGRDAPIAVLQQVNEEYRRLYGRYGIEG